MTCEEIQAALESEDAEVILDGLAVLKAERDCPPTAQIARACERLVKHSDPDVRSEVVAALGIHWAHASLFASILEAARFDEDVDVRVAGARALARYVDTRRDEVCTALAAIVKEEDGRSDLRAVAYLGLLDAEGRLSPSEKATMPEDIGALNVDAELLRRWT